MLVTEKDKIKDIGPIFIAEEKLDKEKLEKHLTKSEIDYLE